MAAVVSGVAAAMVCVCPARAVTIRPDGFLEVDGEAFFPVGLLDLGSRKYDDWNDQIRRSGANCIWDYEIAYTDTTPRCRAVVDSARATGYRLLIGSGDTINWDDPATPELEVDVPLYDPDGLDSLLVCAAGDPAVILGFTNRDEPVWSLARGVLGDIDAAHIHDTYRQIHERVPGTFVAMNFAPVHVSADFDTWKSDVESFLPATDIVMHAAYPYPPGPGTCIPANVLGWPECSLDRLADNADLFRLNVNRPGQPLWMIVQAFKGIPRDRARWTAWTSVVHGATGIFWAGWTWEHPLGDGIDIWPDIREVVREVAGLHGFLVGRDATPVDASEPDVDVRALEHIEGEEMLVVAVSRHGFSGRVEMRVPLAAGGTVEVLSENRTLTVSEGRIVDDFGVYEAHVYRYPRLGGRAGSPSGRLSVRAFPNPSTGRLRAVLDLPGEAFVVVRVHDVAGRRVARVGSGRFQAGPAELVWNGRDASGEPVAPGLYFLRAEASSGEVATTRAVMRR